MLPASLHKDTEGDRQSDSMVFSAHKKRGPRCRTGCITCRVRRIKCDEAKPWCLKCTSTGRKCDGYQLSLGSGDKPSGQALALPKSKPQNARTSEITLPDDTRHQRIHRIYRINISSLPLDLRGTKDERRAVAHFQQCTAVALSGYFRSEVWNSMVLRMSHEEPSIRHAVIALSSLHEGLSVEGDPDADKSQDTFHQHTALKHHHKAVQQSLQLFQRNDPSMVDSLLISSLLFICYELIQQDYSMAVVHFISGLRLLLAAPKSEVRSKVEPAYHRIVIQGLFLGSVYVHQCNVRQQPITMEQPFYKPSDAQESLDEMFIISYPILFEGKHGSEFRDDFSEKSTADYPRVTSRVERWQDCFDRFVNECKHSFSKKDLVAIKLLQIHYGYLMIMLRLAGGVLPDNITPEFAHVLGLIEEFLDEPIDTGDKAQRKLLFNYTFDLGIIGPLFYTAVRSSSYEIQWKAVKLLNHERVPKHEGLWSKAMALQVARGAVRLEQEIDREILFAIQSGQPSDVVDIETNADTFGDPEDRPIWKAKGRFSNPDQVSPNPLQERQMQRSTCLVIERQPCLGLLGLQPRSKTSTWKAKAQSIGVTQRPHETILDGERQRFTSVEIERPATYRSFQLVMRAKTARYTKIRKETITW